MFKYVNIIFLLILTSTKAAEDTDELNEMFHDVNDIFMVNKPRTFWKPAKACPDIPQCKCIDESSKYGVQVDCKGRNLTNIPSRLPLNVSQLILSKNSISTIPDNIFGDYGNMTFLDLSFNRITQLGKYSFSGLNNLKVMNLEMNQIRYMNTSIDLEAFHPLTHLSALNIQQDFSNFLDEERYPFKALLKLPSLKQLVIDGVSNNIIHEQLVDVSNYAHNERFNGKPNAPFNEQYHEMPNATMNDQHLKMQSLKILQLGGINRRCNITKVTEGMFQNLRGLSTLMIKCCKLTLVQNKSFTELLNLESLDLSYNEDLEFKNFANISYGLQFTHIRKLSLIKIHTTFGDCTKLSADNLRYLYNSSLEYIFLDSNRLALFDSDAVKYIPRSLIGLSMNDNKLMLGKYVIQIAAKIAFQDFFGNLKIFLIASQRVSHSFKELFKQISLKEIVMKLPDHRKLKRSINTQRSQYAGNMENNKRNDLLSSLKSDFEAKQSTHKTDFKSVWNLIPSYSEYKCKVCQNISHGIIPLPLPQNLTVADLSNLRINTIIKPLCFCENKLKNLSLNGNTFWYWKGPLLGLTELTHLNLAWDYCQRISLDFFHYFPKLKHLNVPGNYLGFPLSTDENGTIFSKLDQLEVLNMSSNKIKFMPYKIFNGLELLQELYLDSNQIQTVNWNMNRMVKLKLINLHDNQIINIDGNVRQQWNNLIFQHAFSVDLSNNSFVCNCEHLDLINWFSDTKVHFIRHQDYKCKFSNNTNGYLINGKVISRSLTKECASFFKIILSTSLAITTALFVTIAGIAYRYRWNLRYMYYSAKFKIKGYSPVKTEDGEFEHDVFVSYAEGDGTFVCNQLVPELENNRGLNLLVHDRDFQAGNYVNDNIMQAITTCRKTLIIMSRHFLRSKWCCYEMNMARMEGIKTGRDVICIIMKEEVPTKGLPLEIIDIIKEKTYLECPSENNDHLQQFWDRLADALQN